MPAKNPDLQKSLGSWAFRYRGGLWTVFFIAFLFLAHPTLPSLLWGFPFVLTGQILRFWAAGSICFYRGEEVKAEELVTWGPFGWIRNPLYLGNGLIGLGWSLMAGCCLMPMAYTLFFVFLYVGVIIPHEEHFLEKTFQTAYCCYRNGTPMLMPRRLPRKTDFQGPFQTAILWKSERHSLYVTVLGTALFFVKYLWL